MATLHINWHAKPALGFTRQGKFLKRDKVTISGTVSSPVTAPLDADYATVWADAACAIRCDGNAADDSASRAIAALFTDQITEIVAGKTTITAITI
ncbi:MAG: hypothetical protein DI551_07980 [Micavibrio aeruginosavorus]|uniref:Uncharacterized protein n=1 Tax=Micavibrio aeruginosavorus TaxID=349221 RepID=A0A2W5MY15_9BACT|nr:MAG: hypothetical protein DI551_07980 [Micavibrio aeruginosavorus]